MVLDLELNNGIKVPKLAYGTYLVEDKEIIKNAIKIGYRHIDGADVYGNQETVAKAIHEAIDEGIVIRQELFIVSKVPETKFGYQSTIDCCLNSLKVMNLEYFDMYLLHSPYRRSENWQNYVIDSWRALEKLYKDGIIKSIGVSNFSVRHLKFLLEKAEIKPMINQMEIHPEHQNKEVTDFCKINNIALSSWGALNQGRIFKNSVFQEVAKNSNATIAQVAIKWNLEKGYIPIATSHKYERIELNFNADKIQLSQDDIKKLDALDGGEWSKWHNENTKPTKWIDVKDIQSLINKKETFIPSKTSYKIFGFIPFLKKYEQRTNKTKWYLWGIPVLTIRKKEV